MAAYAKSNIKFTDHIETNSMSEEALRQEQLKQFAQDIDRIRQEVEEQMGQEDATYIEKIQTLSKRFEIAGRSLIHFSIDPFTFSIGILSLWLHKQLETSEIGHSALHGAFDQITTNKRYHAKTHKWKFPVDEQSWRYAHNMRHHSFTNVAGKDPDIHFGIVRLTPETPHRWVNYFQVPITLFFIIPNFGNAINAHATGLLDVYLGNGRDDKFDFIKDRSPKSILSAHKKALRKWIPYFVENYVFYPALAGPFFWKVALGNWSAERLRDVYTGVTVFCGHVGDDVTSSISLKKNLSRGEWYVLQVESANNFKVNDFLSKLCGGLDYQIEHHLFPKLPPNRLRQISHRVKEVCEQHEVSYKTDTWPKTFSKVLTRLGKLSFNTKN